MSQTYERRTLNSANPLARFAHRSRHKTSIRVVSEIAPRGGSVLDFGAGTGIYLNHLSQDRDDLQLFAFEPYMALKYSGITQYKAMSEVGERSIDVLCAFETLEHVEDEDIEAFIAAARRVCRGHVVVSVPVMQGVALPLKIANHVLFRGRTDYSVGEVLRGTFGRSVARTPTRQTSHKGFDHRALFRQLSAQFTVERRFFAPLPGLPWWVNSQAFMVFRVR